MTATLISSEDAESKIASLTAASCNVEVVEERAFVGNKGSTPADKRLSLGSLKLALQAGDENSDAEHRRAFLGRDGTFELSLPSVSDTKRALEELLGANEEGADRREREQRQRDIRSALDSIAAIYVRAGMVNPIFDPGAIEGMPFRRAATVVSDTSGILQGGLDFIVRHIPKARVKVPAIVQMEIRNFSHRFFKIRRESKDTKKKQRAAKQLLEHLKSQGAERALLRLELKDDVEIERTYLLGDPLRSAFVHDRDSTLTDLQLSVPLDTYVDRLILEAARHHQAQSEPGHAVLLLTSDQGQARMALAEGVKPLYFRKIRAEEVFGQRLTGRPPDPFTGEPRPVPLASLIWELATAFGHARLTSDDGTFTVSAIGEHLPWSPYHSIDDLLWYEIKKEGQSLTKLPRQSDLSEVPAPSDADLGRAAPPVPPRYQRMNVNRLLALICALDDRQALDQAEIEQLLRLSPYSTSHYRSFLVSADYIRLEGDRWTATDRLKEVSIAARNEDPQSMQRALAHAPSFQALVKRVKDAQDGEPLDLSDMRDSARRTYLVLGELTLLCASVGRSAVFPTLNHPDPADFSELALARFEELAGPDMIVATGRWLESLIEHDGIHPVVARRSLEQAAEAGLLRRSTEGSTAQTRYDDHMVHVLQIEEGMPVAKPIHLYRGDYLIPGKASVSLRLEEVES